MAGDKVDCAGTEARPSRWRQKVRHVSHPSVEGISVMSVVVDGVHLVEADLGESIGLFVDGDLDCLKDGGRFTVRERNDQIGLAGHVDDDVGGAVGRSDT
jgi:hypothetical protein